LLKQVKAESSAQVMDMIAGRPSEGHLILRLSLVKEGSQVCKFMLVELAGSEQLNEEAQMTSNEKSLFTLARVVYALTQKLDLKPPYLESKLTQILAASFGGNCFTTLIATVSASQ